jgi:hypothetical protein
MPVPSSNSFLPPQPLFQQNIRPSYPPPSNISGSYGGTNMENDISENELQLIQNSSRNVYLPQNNQQGMPVKLKRLKHNIVVPKRNGGKQAQIKKKIKEEDSNKSRSRSRSSRGSRDKVQRSQLDHEKEYDEENEDEEDNEDYCEALDY